MFELVSPRLSRCAAVVVLAIVGIGLPGCGDLSEFVKPITPAEISGEWRATDLRITNANDPTISVSPLASGGSLFLRFSIDGGFQSIIQTPGQENDVETGTYEIVEDFILIEPSDAPGDTLAFSYEFQSTKTAFSLTLLSDDYDYDFVGDGTQEPALLYAIVIR